MIHVVHHTPNTVVLTLGVKQLEEILYACGDSSECPPETYEELYNAMEEKGLLHDES